MGSGFLHFGRTPDTSLPTYMQDPSLYDGSYRDANNKTVVSSMHNVSSTSARATNDTMRALARAVMIHNGTNADGFGLNADMCVAEITMSDRFEGPDVGSGQAMVMAVKYAAAPGTKKILCSVNGKAAQAKDVKPWCVLLAMMMLFRDNFPEFEKSFLTLCGSNFSDDEKMAAALICSDIMYYLTDATGAQYSITLNDLATASNLSTTMAGSSKFAPARWYGNLQTFVTNGRATAANMNANQVFVDPVSFNGKYQLVDPASLTAEERALIPVLDSKYIISEEVENACRMVKWAIDSHAPVNFNNILLRSAPGYGKSTIYVIMAAAFGLPLHTLALNAMSEPLDLVGSFVPLSGEIKTAKEILGAENVPSAEDMCIDPMGCYKDITGKDNPNATESDCLSALMTLAAKHAEEEAKKNGGINAERTKVEFVPGIIPAMSRPCMIGLDEISMPMNAGVVPTLHPLMDDTQRFTLPTGEVVTRNPLTIMVGTTNLDLEGNRAINQAYQDRNGLIIDLTAPSDAELKARVIANTGFDETKYPNLDLDSFIRCYNEMRDVAARDRLTDGTIGPRKLSQWLMASMFMGSVRKAAEVTIIPGGTSDMDGKQDLREKVEAIFAD